MSQPVPPAAIMRREFEAAAHDHRSGAARAPQANIPLADQGVRAGDAATRVEQAIANAANRTGVDFGYLIAQAQVESAMNPHAKAPTSSATGLYQFIDSTWLETMQRHGDRFGLGAEAAAISTGPGGRAHISDPAQRQAILALRNDPQVAALMAAGLAEDNRAHLAPILGRQPQHDELYLAHFLGAGGAGRFLSALEQDPGQSAAALFRRPAAANRAVFFEPGGAPRSLDGVMDFLSAKLAKAGSGNAVATQFAQADISESPATPAQNSRARARTFAAAARPLGASLPSTGFALNSGATGPQPMSATLRAAFGGDPRSLGASPQAALRIERAYTSLKAMGL